MVEARELVNAARVFALFHRVWSARTDQCSNGRAIAKLRWSDSLGVDEECW